MISAHAAQVARPDALIAVWLPAVRGSRSRCSAIVARHAGLDGETGRLAGTADDGGPRKLVISRDYYSTTATPIRTPTGHNTPEYLP